MPDSSYKSQVCTYSKSISIKVRHKPRSNCTNELGSYKKNESQNKKRV